MPRVAEVLLAAGEGRRIGGPKALLRAGSETLVARLARTSRAAGCDPVIAVCGFDAEAVAAEARATGAVAVENRAWRSGQTSSLKAGLAALPPESAAFLVHPVDHAFTTVDDVRALLAAFATHSAPDRAILRPVHAGREFGHPVLYGRGFLAEFLSLGDDEPARLVYRRHLDSVILVPVSNQLIARDLDTPEDLALLGAP
jgi:nicotine blue oxidoreductase